MQSLGGLFRATHATEQGQFSAAHTLDAINTVLNDRGFLAQDAKASSVQSGVITVLVSHGIVAARIRQQEQEVLADAKDVLRRRGAQPGALERIITRLQQPQ